jgi:quercetin dioxygenase-like cupin family protein
MRRGTGTPLHRHDLDEETFIVLTGSLALLADGTRVDAGPGEIVYLPGGRVHATSASSCPPGRGTAWRSSRPRLPTDPPGRYV